MPLQPLIDDSTGGARLLRALRVAPVLIIGFGTLLMFNLAQTASLLLLPFSRSAFRRFNRWCANVWWGWCVSAARRLNKIRLELTGDDVPVAENALVIANHQQMPDILALMILARSKQRLGDLKFFVKHALKWFPGAGWGMQFLGFPFLRRDWAADQALIHRTFDAIVEEHIPVWLVSFAEGTRSTPAKILASARWAVEHGIDPFRHLITPRTKGFVATVGALREHVDAIYDITIGYERGVPTLWQLIVGCVDRFHLHVERIPIAALPSSEAQLRDWLLERYRVKDALLESFYSTGSFGDVGGAESRL
jgi:1-acyl-sn-glycerol-3-phosphate acyltransferase